ncbi:MAG: transcriptional regulator [Alkaliphilus sp.]|jgi:hypothetical protein|nr:MAG: transcriptional regulator [Alkaliphilus sp.]
MLIIDESTVKVGGVILPGIYKSFEIKGSARVEEIDIKGKKTKPKQATGYSDAKMYLELRLLDDSGKTALEKLATIQALFKKAGQKKPIVHEIINEHTSARGVTRVILKDLNTKEKSGKSEISATLEFWEYIPIKITAVKSAPVEKEVKKVITKTEIALSDEFREYLEGRSSKTAKSPAIDTASTIDFKSRLGIVPF